MFFEDYFGCTMTDLEQQEGERFEGLEELSEGFLEYLGP
jgi:hypothetical protein